MNILSKGLIIAGVIASTAVITAPSAHATTSTTCVDGSKSSNLKVTWKSHSNVTIASVGNAPLCADTTLYFSSYTVPDTYDGKGFNATAAPQTIFDSTSVVLKKGAVPAANLTITLPEECKHKQVDVYYGPEIKHVDAKGHGAQFISGYVISKTLDKCEPVVPTPEEPKPTPVPPVVVPVVPAPVTPTELPKTGSVDSTAVVMALLSVATYAGAYALAAKRS